MTGTPKVLLPLALGAALLAASGARADGDIPHPFIIPTSEKTLRLYGFAELDWVHLFNNDNSDIDFSTFAPYLPLHGSEQAKSGGRDYFTARVTRIGIEGGMPTKYGALAARIEGDFSNDPRTGNAAVYGDIRNIYTQHATNGYGFRLRHAYGQFGGLLAGQTWSTFMDVDNFPETVDFNGPIGGTFIRQPQIRYAYAARKAGTFTVALENSVTYVLDVSDPTNPVPMNNSHSRIPDLVVRWDKEFGFGALSLRAITQQLRLEGGGIDATRQGFGAAASGLVKTRGGKDFLTWGVTGGKGIGRYLNYIEGAAFDPGSDSIKLEQAIAGYLGYQFKASDVLRFNFAYGFTYSFDSEYTDFARAAGFDRGRFGVNRFVNQGHAGFFVTPVPETDFGVEAIYGARETLAKEKGDEFRTNLLARYYIN